MLKAYDLKVVQDFIPSYLYLFEQMFDHSFEAAVPIVLCRNRNEATNEE